jgi:cysteinyl-tRNA synthetase
MGIWSFRCAKRGEGMKDRTTAVLTLAVGIFLVLSPALAATPKTTAGTTTPPKTPTWQTVQNFLYQLQNEKLPSIQKTKFQLVIMDPSRNGSDDQGAYTQKEIQALKNSPGAPKLVLAYLSIGEAEDYRNYWQQKWDAKHDGKPDPDAPQWLGSQIYPEWTGNYVVKYWDPEWQAIMLKRVNQIVDAGFDGVYLDRIDSYEYWLKSRPGAANDMINFVKKIAETARTRSGNTNFGVFPQGGFMLASRADYVAVCTGIGNEDNWHTDNRRNNLQDTNEILQELDRFKKAGKLVLVTDYVTQTSLINDFYKKALAKGYVPYATVRDLNRITINKGHEPQTLK